jgi:REP element-mobilizing transposase RayT
MPFTKIWIHLVWATKKREPLMLADIRPKIFTHIKENGTHQNIHTDFVNGHLEHIHCLISLKSTQNIATVAQLLKGESSHWINKHNLCSKKLEWQDDYFAVSVSESDVNRVREYIKNQEEHHKKKTFKEEYDEFMNKYGFNLING